nr:hypothetical protein [Endozoicomonas sp.]
MLDSTSGGAAGKKHGHITLAIARKQQQPHAPCSSLQGSTSIL